MLVLLKDALSEINSRCVVFFDEEPVFVHEDSYYAVESISNKLTKGSAYIIGEYVYPYIGKIKKGNDIDKLKPGIYDHCSEVYYVPVKNNNRIDKERYSTANIASISLSSIWSEVENNKNNFITEEDREMINSNIKEYMPTLKNDDDPLKRLIKQAIKEKGVNINLYKSAFDKKHGLTNTKSTLNSKTNLTILKFLQWCEILGLDYRMEVYDNCKDKHFPLDKTLVYDSGKDTE